MDIHHVFGYLKFYIKLKKKFPKKKKKFSKKKFIPRFSSPHVQTFNPQDFYNSIKFLL